MSDRHIFPSKDDDFNSYVQMVIAYLIDWQPHLRITDDDLDEALGLVIEWNTNWEVYDDANLSNKLCQKGSRR